MSALVIAAVIVAGLVVVQARFAAPRYRGARSDHFDGRRFHNHQRTEQRSFLKWQLTRKAGRWPRWIDEPYAPGPPPRVEGDLRVTFINHATTLIQMDGLNILTDPIWSDRCSPVSFAGPKRHRNPGIRFEDLPPIDVVLVSHNHYDHMDLPTLRRLHGARIVTPLGNAKIIGEGEELDWWQELRLSDKVKVTLVPAQHFCARAISDRNATLWGGFVISGPSGHAYFAGDTGWGPHFEEIAKRFDPIRVALLPIGAYLPRWFMKPAHIDPAEAVEAHFKLRAQTSIAIHYGTFRLGDDGFEQPVDDLRRAIEANGDPRFWILKHGEGRYIH